MILNEQQTSGLTIIDYAEEGVQNSCQAKNEISNTSTIRPFEMGR
ncbi:hypothetical protein PTRA_a0489 [Pseudoalteromonas translucida KMM 520]|uniref:Uncharacterized protein n=1 Tax=Pseudoalteromonas translucida KMM 520 TaxID=1315283 RepID=A0A0U2NE67_9GAMM|nr:hypothetical protein [Pseudoalteromonas translucida]ALS31843.1 hypothetical protein PTRA_a0489 [Pseudoalteromonas translucida KMM 520]